LSSQCWDAVTKFIEEEAVVNHSAVLMQMLDATVLSKYVSPAYIEAFEHKLLFGWKHAVI
jgi:hypothetical protein